MRFLGLGSSAAAALASHVTGGGEVEEWSGGVGYRGACWASDGGTVSDLRLQFPCEPAPCPAAAGGWPSNRQERA